MNTITLFWKKLFTTHPLFGNVAHVDHLWRVIQEAAKASQPHQILFVFQLEVNGFIKRTEAKATSSKSKAPCKSPSHAPRW